MPAISRAQESVGSTLRMFATCTPGLARVLARYLSTLDGVRVAWRGRDGRADVVSFSAPVRKLSELMTTLRVADDVYVQIGHARRSEGDRASWLAQRLCRAEQLRLAVAARGAVSVNTYRVIARVLSERSFIRTDLRRQAEATIRRIRPTWRLGDPAGHEIWVCEYRPGSFVAGLRMTGGEHRQRGGRSVERQAALRPSVAAAMVYLAGSPPGMLLDPCCGSGTILAEAVAEGWQARGFDIDNGAVAAAHANVPEAVVCRGDARRLPIGDGEVAAWVSNVPFGRLHRLPGNPVDWFTSVLAEATRVLQPGGRVVTLSLGVPRHALPANLLHDSTHKVRVLGMPAVIDVFVRQ